MDSIIHYTHCPVCGSPNIDPVFSTKDYTVTGQPFLICQCSNCSVRFTQDVPPPNSIAKYYRSEEYISHTNSSKGLINRLYHLVRKTTLKRKRELVCHYTGLEKGNLLDVGSGTGAFVNEMAAHNWEVVGLEPDEGARAIAMKSFHAELKDTGELFRLRAQQFDVITLWHVLEHVHDLHGYVAQFRKLLKENGVLIVAVPNYTSHDAQVYKQFWAAYDVPRHLYHFAPQSMACLAEQHQLTVADCEPMWFDSFYVSLLSSKYKSRSQSGKKGRTNWFAALSVSLISNFKAMRDKKKCSSIIYLISKK